MSKDAYQVRTIVVKTSDAKVGDIPELPSNSFAVTAYMSCVCSSPEWLALLPASSYVEYDISSCEIDAYISLTKANQNSLRIRRERKKRIRQVRASCKCYPHGNWRRACTGQ